jgi:GT2 family glycosyltransferase
MEFKYSVVIPTFNEIRDLEVTVAMAWASEPAPHEIIVVDDQSDDPVSERLLSFPDVKVVRPPKRLGAGPAKRFGAEMATGDVIVLMDSHMRMPHNWLEQADEAIDNNPNSIFCAACRNFKGTWMGCGARFSRTTSRGSPDIFLGRNWIDRGDVKTVDRCPCLLGGCYFIPKHIWTHLQGINPLLSGWGYGEQDLSIRAWLFGYEVRRMNGLCIPHRFQKDMHKRKPGITKMSTWHNQFNGMVVAASLFEDGVFERLFAPYFKQTAGSDSVLAFEEVIEEVNDFRAYVQGSRIYSDEELHALCNYRLPTPAEQQSRVDAVLSRKAKDNKKRRQESRREEGCAGCTDEVPSVVDQVEIIS